MKDLNGMTEDAFLQKIKEIFEVSELIAKDKHSQEKGTFSMYLKERWYTCKVRPEDQSEDPVKGLDVSLLQNLMLTPVLGITDPKTDPRIDFCRWYPWNKKSWKNAAMKMQKAKHLPCIRPPLGNCLQWQMQDF